VFGDAKSGQLSLEPGVLADYAVERADLSTQLRSILEPQLKEKGQERVFFEIESKLLPVLVDMEHEGIRIDSQALADFSAQLSKKWPSTSTPSTAWLDASSISIHHANSAKSFSRISS